jgi:hypothetical protein
VDETGNAIDRLFRYAEKTKTTEMKLTSAEPKTTRVEISQSSFISKKSKGF